LGGGTHGDTWIGIHPFQVFDGGISQSQAKQDAYRYDFVWGTSKPNAWRQGNPAIMTSWYAPFDGDFTLQHDIGWWNANHPGWVLYKCDGKRLASLDGLKNVPLDISNPNVVKWQMQTYAPGIENGGYQSLAEDLVGLDNSTGGCGVWINGAWHQRFSGQNSDPAWTQAVLKWQAYATNYLHALPTPISTSVNTVPESRPFGDASMNTLIANVDLVDDESSFTDYGTGYAPWQKVQLIVQWMQYVQNLQKSYVVDDKWNTNKMSHEQFGWAVATYLLGKYHYGSLFVDHLPGYGYEYWVSQYKAAVGSPCADFYPDPNEKGVFYRKYTGAFVAVNASSTTPYTVTLPQSSYTDLWGVTVTSPVQIPPDTGEVLLTNQNGCL